MNVLCSGTRQFLLFPFYREQHCAPKAEGVHLQPGNKVPGSTDPNGSSQVSQNRRGRDDPTSQTNDQNTKILEGGIKVSLCVSTRGILHDIAFRLSSQSSSVLLSEQYCMHNRFDHNFMKHKHDGSVGLVV